MPDQISVTELVSVPLATEDELLAFCNRVRSAGGAEVLEALLPSDPNKSHTCLIANNLNFGCRVMPGRTAEQLPLFINGTRSRQWFMVLPGNLTAAVVYKVAKAIWDGDAPEDAIVPYESERALAIKLPEAIGNSAQAFDKGLAFHDFVRKQARPKFNDDTYIYSSYYGKPTTSCKW